MPKELPNAADLWEGAVSFFSIDTDLIQSAGYDFSAGALNQLPLQLPSAMKLQLSEVVVQEVVKHQMESVLKAIAQFNAASNDLKRLANLDMKSIDNDFSNKKAEMTAKTRFRKIIEEYADRCNGDILPIGGEDLAAKVFAHYFSGDPPFGQRKEKKSEFPDATTLVLLESYAKENKTKGIFASRDGGVNDFAAQSEHLYCVKSIDELATLFAATDEHAQAIKARVTAAISNAGSVLHEKLGANFEHHVAHARWDINDLYCGSVSRVEGYPAGANLDGYEICIEQTAIWESQKAGAWIVDLVASANVSVAVDVVFYVWDSIDREELELGTQRLDVPTSIEVRAFLNCSGISLENEPTDWEVEVDIAPGDYGVDVGEIDPEFGPD